MKPWNGKSDSNRDAKSKDIYLRKREDVCALVRAEAALWIAWLLGGHSVAREKCRDATGQG